MGIHVRWEVRSGLAIFMAIFTPVMRMSPRDLEPSQTLEPRSPTDDFSAQQGLRSEVGRQVPGAFKIFGNKVITIKLGPFKQGPLDRMETQAGLP